MCDYTNTAIKLDELETKKVLEVIDPKKKNDKGASRIVNLLAKRRLVSTVEVNQICAVGNISDIVSRYINPKIYPIGLFISCQRPHTPLKNKFDQNTTQFLWSFYRLPDVVNERHCLKNESICL